MNASARAPSLFERQSTWWVISRVGIYLVLLAGAAVLMVPLAWMLTTSLKEDVAVFAFPPEWIPNPVAWHNYPDVFVKAPFARFYLNTMIITGISLIGQVASASLVAFGFARLRFRGRNTLFVVVLATMMLPYAVYMVPSYVFFHALGWVDTFLPLIVPNFFGGGAFYIFLLRQFYMRHPLELDDAAKIDGCSFFGIYSRIILPLSAPALGVVAIFSFLGHWNDFLAPLIYLTSDTNFTLALGITWFKGQYVTDWNLLMAGSLLIMAPCIVVFFLAQRYFIQGIVFTGIKG